MGTYSPLSTLHFLMFPAREETHVETWESHLATRLVGCSRRVVCVYMCMLYDNIRMEITRFH